MNNLFYWEVWRVNVIALQWAHIKQIYQTTWVKKSARNHNYNCNVNVLMPLGVNEYHRIKSAYGQSFSIALKYSKLISYWNWFYWSFLNKASLATHWLWFTINRNNKCLPQKKIKNKRRDIVNINLPIISFISVHI